MFKSKTYLTILVISVVILTIFGLYGIMTIHEANSGYWSNYWTAAPVILSVIIVLFQIDHNDMVHDNEDKKEDITNAKEKFDETVYEVSKEFFPYFFDFNEDVDKLSDNDKYSLAKKLLALINASYALAKRRKEIQNLLNEDFENDENIDIINCFSSNLNNVIYTNSNISIIKIVNKIYSGYNPAINLNEVIRLNKNRDYKQMVENRISGAWIINSNSAEKAKYLIGVAVDNDGNKTVLGAYILNGKIKVDPVTGRITFENLKQIYPDFEKNDSENYHMETLDDWNTQNPVLYYKNYLNKNNVSEENAKNDLKHLNINNFNSLGDRDVIIVKITDFGNK